MVIGNDVDETDGVVASSDTYTGLLADVVVGFVSNVGVNGFDAILTFEVTLEIIGKLILFVSCPVACSSICKSLASSWNFFISSSIDGVVVMVF